MRSGNRTHRTRPTQRTHPTQRARAPHRAHRLRPSLLTHQPCTKFSVAIGCDRAAFNHAVRLANIMTDEGRLRVVVVSTRGDHILSSFTLERRFGLNSINGYVVGTDTHLHDVWDSIQQGSEITLEFETIQCSGFCFVPAALPQKGPVTCQ